MTEIKDIYDYINKIAPYDDMEKWDNSGFTVGDINRKVTKVVMALDARLETVRFAFESGAELILTHHPVIFGGIKNVYENTAVYELIKNNVCALCAHTSYDKARGGINDCLAALLKLENTKVLESGYLIAGDLPDEMSIDDFAETVKNTLDVKGLRYTDTDRIIKRVAVGGGACGEYLEEAMKNADCFVTGELKYHEMLFAADNNFAAINAGHYETENAPFLMLKERLEKEFSDVEFIVSPVGNPVMDL